MQIFLTALLQCSVSMSLVTLVYAAILPLLSKRYAAKWRYMVWLVIAAGWIFPFRPRIDLSFLPAQMADIPVTPVQPIINAIPPMADTGDIVSAPATIPLWWVLAAIWIAGVVSVVLYHALRHGRFMKMVRRWGEPVTNLENLGILVSLKSEMGIKAQVGLSVCQSITSPMLVGFFRPAILLPPIKIAEDELSLILKHELIHFQRHDLWYKALILTATALHWFNPAVYLMAKATAVQCEISCDALVLQGADFQQRKQYGETIIGVVRNGAKLQTALSTNFYGGKKDMKTRISSIMDTKRKKAGVAVFCVVLIGIMMGGATLAAAADKEPPNGNVTFVEGAAYVETPESKAEMYARYEQYGLTYNKSTDQLFFNGELVRYFEDYYPVGDSKNDAYSGIDYFNENGTIDVHGIRDLSQATNYNPGGKVIGVEPYSQADFDARDIKNLNNPPQYTLFIDEAGPNGTDGKTLEEIYSEYAPFGLTYDKEKNYLIYDGKTVRSFVDALSPQGSILSMFNEEGTIDVSAVRDYSDIDADGHGKLTGVKALSQEEFDKRTQERANHQNESVHDIGTINQ